MRSGRLLGDDLRVVGAEGDDYGWELTRGLTPFGRLRLFPGRPALMTLEERGLHFERFGRGWRLTLADDAGQPRGWYDAKGWRSRGRLVVAPDHELRLAQPIGWRDARLTDDEGAVLARFELYRSNDRRCLMSEVVGELPSGVDPVLVWSFAAALVLMRAELRAPPGPGPHSGEGGGGWFDGGLGGVFGGDGGGGGGGGGGGDGGGGGGGG